jgi:hypothetical protein
MNRPNFKKMTVTELVLEYACAAEQYGRFVGINSKTTNRQAAIIAGCYRELRARGKDEQRALLNLLEGNNEEFVRCWVGAHALEFAPEVGEPTLSELSKKPSFVGFVARETLGRWKEGQLKFP